MRWFNALFAVFFLVVCAPFTLSATIEGELYDSFLEPVSSAVITIDTTPNQQQIVRNGSYSFEVPPGSYTITAQAIEQGVVVLEDSSEITVSDEGTFALDLLLFTVLDEDLEDSADVVIADVGFEEEPASGAPWYLYLALVLLVLVFGWQVWKRVASKEVAPDDLEPYIAFLRSEKRTTQKDMRKEFPLSEAKISLIVAELVSKRYVQKIKKGRGNVLVYTGK